MPNTYVKSTQFTGVRSRDGGKAWSAYIRINKAFPDHIIAQYGLGKRINVGTLDTEELAAHAHDV